MDHAFSSDFAIQLRSSCLLSVARTGPVLLCPIVPIFVFINGKLNLIPWDTPDRCGVGAEEGANSEGKEV
jgi:hypothetical protein